jgi:excisionase family DNA binding protein
MTYAQEERFEKILKETELLTPAQVAQRLDIPRQTVYTWIKRKYFPVTRLAGRVYIRPADLSAVIVPAHSETP